MGAEALDIELSLPQPGPLVTWIHRPYCPLSGLESIPPFPADWEIDFKFLDDKDLLFSLLPLLVLPTTFKKRLDKLGLKLVTFKVNIREASMETDQQRYQQRKTGRGSVTDAKKVTERMWGQQGRRPGCFGCLFVCFCD